MKTNFSGYGDHLILESMNEEGCFDDLWNHYSGSEDGKADAYSIVNRINQKFVDLVRSSGGNNPERHLLIAGYATDVDMTCDEMFQMPEDSAGRCAATLMGLPKPSAPSTSTVVLRRGGSTGSYFSWPLKGFPAEPSASTRV